MGRLTAKIRQNLIYIHSLYSNLERCRSFLMGISNLMKVWDCLNNKREHILVRWCDLKAGYFAEWRKFCFFLELEQLCGIRKITFLVLHLSFWKIMIILSWASWVKVKINTHIIWGVPTFRMSWNKGHLAFSVCSFKHRQISSAACLISCLRRIKCSYG